VAVCDDLADRRQQASSELGVRAYSSFEELIADDGVELLVVAVPSSAHADQARRGLEAGKHVLVEKPFATSLEEAQMLYKVAAKQGRLLIASQNLRFAADFMRVREIVESGHLGQLVEIRVAWHWFRRRWDWQTVRKLGGGSLLNDGTHVIDYVLLLVEQELPDIFCRLAHTPLSIGDAEDYVKIVLSGPGAPVIDLEFTNACAYPGDQWLIMGTRGSLVGGHGKYRVRYIDPLLLGARVLSEEPTAGRAYNKEELTWAEETIDVSSETYTMSHQRLYLAVYEAVRNGGPSPVPPESVLRQMATIEACRAAAGEIMEVSA
jgi:predicted dehydrogenase